jgi:hypothetical protein
LVGNWVPVNTHQPIKCSTWLSKVDFSAHGFPKLGINYNLLIYTIDKYLEVVLKFELELYSDHILKNLIA